MIINKARLKTHLFKPILVVIFSISFIIVGALALFYKSDIDTIHAKDIQAISSNIDISIAKDVRTYINALKFIRENDKLKKAWLAKDRDRLYQLALPIYTQLNQDIRTTHFYFHSVDKVNFLRVHRPEDHSDFIDRDTLKFAEQSQDIYWGLEIGIFGWHVLRIVSPWYENGELIGYIEIGEEVTQIFKGLSDLYDVTNLILINKDKVSKTKWQNIYTNSSYPWDSLEKFIVFPGENNLSSTKIIKAIQTHYEQGALTSFTLLLNRRFFYVTSIPIMSANGNVESYALPFFDITEHIHSKFISLSVFILVLFSTWYFLGRFFFTQITHVEQELDSTYERLESEIEERKLTQKKLHRAAFYDSLTGLPNRSLMLNRLEQTIKANIRNKNTGIVMFLDLDHFKKINDSLGHAFGDKVLQKVANRIKSNIRACDTLSRLGGDEFIIIIPQINVKGDNYANNIIQVLQKITTLFQQPFQIDDYQFNISTSIGASIFPTDSSNVDNLIKYADAAMYKAKNKGRNTAVLFEAKIQQELEYRINLENDLRKAIKNEDFFLEYQPKFDNNNNIIGAEALVRWQHSEKGRIPPDDFITIAEETGLIIELSEWIINTALATTKEINQQLAHNNFCIAINISPLHFQRHDFIRYINKTSSEHDVSSKNVILEITEGVILDNVKEIQQKILKLKENNFSISIDDFGTGYSSLAYLRDLAINELKIDRSFVNDIGKHNTAVVESIIALGKHLGLKVVAEGVENETQLIFLKKHKCNFYQGYYLSKPIDQVHLYRLLNITPDSEVNKYETLNFIDTR